MYLDNGIQYSDDSSHKNNFKYNVFGLSLNKGLTNGSLLIHNLNTGQSKVQSVVIRIELILHSHGLN